MRVFCVQTDIVWEDKQANLERVRALLPGAGAEPGSLVLLPEMFASGFSMNVEATADDDGVVQRFLGATARELGVYLMGGVVTRDAERRGLNQAIVFTPEGKEFARYSKLFPFSIGGESAHYAPGSGICAFEWRGCQVAPFICYDLRFPEAFRRATLAGAELITVIANWPTPREHHWVTLLRARAIENQAYVAAVNRTGTDPHHVYGGRSTIIDPHGNVLADAGDAEGIISAEVDVDVVRSWRRAFPVLKDVRRDLLG